MITQVSIKDLRGIADGTVSDLTPLTILTGVNGSGKSTVLDALFLGADPFSPTAIPRVIRRRASREFTGDWLFRARLGSGRISVIRDGAEASVGLRWVPKADIPSDRPAVAFAAIETSVKVPHRGNTGNMVLFHSDGSSSLYSSIQIPAGHRSAVRLIDMRGFVADAPDLTDVLTEAKSAGFGVVTVQLLSAVAPALKNLEILKVGVGYEVGLVYDDGAVPLSMAGDGVRAVARLALELAALPTGLALLEEPEVHQHPGALKLSAATIVAAVKRGLQVVIATHSLELIDELLLATKKSEMLDKLTVQNLRLTGGVLSSTRFQGPESDRIRNVIGTELR